MFLIISRFDISNPLSAIIEVSASSPESPSPEREGDFYSS
jgi:hypothetical protein